MKEEEYELIKKKISQLTQIDLNNYKESQMMRRLDGFISRTRLQSVRQYCERLDRDAGEVVKLRNFLTINVSEFYRDHAHFETLRNVVLPELLKNSPRLNIWSAGCSDGQEPYSVAVMLNELTPGVKHRILATDIDRESIKKAAAGGPYLLAETKNVPRPLLAKYFSVKDDGYWVNERIRDRVSFSHNDLTRDTFPIGLDLIICRNVTIYFSNEAKSLLNSKFFNSLKENGILFIGATETMLNAHELGFNRWYSCFYRKNSMAAAGQPQMLTPAVSVGR